MGASLAPIGLHLITRMVNQNYIIPESYGKVTICGKSFKFLFCKPFTIAPRSGKKKSNPPTEESLLASRKKTIRKMTDLINCNAWEWEKNNGRKFPPVFLTLTFNEDIKDIKTANRKFSEFMQNYNYRLFKKKEKILQYIAVPEFQPNSGRIHYHIIIFNLPYSNKNYDIARDVWGHGYIWMKAVYRGTTHNIAKYLTKYLTKALDDKRFFKKRKYFPSVKLLKPIVSTDCYVANNILQAVSKTRPEYKVRKYEKILDFIGPSDIYYAELGNDEELSDLLPELDPYTRNVLQSEINKKEENQKL